MNRKKQTQDPVIRTNKNKISDADGDFSKSPYFNFNDDRAKFDTNWVSNANDNYGSASGFLSKSLLYILKGRPSRASFLLLTRI